MTLRAARTFSVGLLCVGDELLDGRVQESNGMVLMHQLRADHGLDLEALVVCRDEEEAIARRVLALSGVHDLVVVCGGLGPTEDDRTREALAAAADQELVYNQEAYERICHRFRARQKTPLPTHRKQALFPQSATVLWNEVGTAAGFCMRVGRSVWMSLPGVPGEFAWCLGAHLGEVLEAAGFEGSGTTWRRRLRFFGIGESALEQRLVGLGAWGGEVVVGYRAAWPELEVSLRGRDAKALEEACALVRSQAGQWLVGEGEEGVLEQVCALLQERGERVTCAESCTGGLLGGELTKQSGSSAWFGRGYITYANRAKQEMLGVSLGVLERWGGGQRAGGVPDGAWGKASFRRDLCTLHQRGGGAWGGERAQACGDGVLWAKWP